MKHFGRDRAGRDWRLDCCIGTDFSGCSLPGMVVSLLVAVSGCLCDDSLYRGAPCVCINGSILHKMRHEYRAMYICEKVLHCPKGCSGITWICSILGCYIRAGSTSVVLLFGANHVDELVATSPLTSMYNHYFPRLPAEQ